MHARSSAVYGLQILFGASREGITLSAGEWEEDGTNGGNCVVLRRVVIRERIVKVMGVMGEWFLVSEMVK